MPEHRLGQSKWGSFIEACANTAFGYLLALVCMNVIMWAYSFPVSPAQTTVIVGWMTVVSVLRGYIIRRMWNAQFWRWKKVHALATSRLDRALDHGAGAGATDRAS